MFTKTKDIQRAFRHIRLFTFLLIISCLLICSVAIYFSTRLAERSAQKVYLLAGGKVLEAYASERGDNFSVEAKDHIETFHRLFFTLAPDEKLITTNISKALYLADASAQKQYEDLRESGFYARVISSNISQELSIDSVHLKTDQQPYQFECYAIQKIIRPTSIVSRSLVTSGQLRDIARSEHNSHGFLIEKWRTLKNEDIAIKTR